MVVKSGGGILGMFCWVDCMFVLCSVGCKFCMCWCNLGMYFWMLDWLYSLVKLFSLGKLYIGWLGGCMFGK